MDDSTLIMAIFGGFAAVMTVVAWLGDRRRHRRADLDRVGFMPWTAMFFWSLLAAVLLLGLSARQALGR
ncbi:hypothetical protein [Novosphingobium sp. AP12]|uniref:hypothetical protein n=1 Tax=Novosphingobium sp. AP12 TaxID=1144305 RepID=UPI0002720FA6|nr:hypothetical protein [Novosphingobium sp. AP12]EJL32401.1 hypothetical protein PMI02_01456 [Novosphingobium sp. AP12]